MDNLFYAKYNFIFIALSLIIRYIRNKKVLYGSIYGSDVIMMIGDVMKKYSLVVLMFLAVFMFAAQPRTVVIAIVDEYDQEYDFSSEPYDFVTFEYWISSRPGEVLDQTSYQAGYETFDQGLSVISLDLQDFITPYQEGDELNVLIKQDNNPFNTLWFEGRCDTLLTAGGDPMMIGFEKYEGTGGMPIEIGPITGGSSTSTIVYPCITTAGADLNFVGLPFQTSFINASDFDLTGTNINAISKWNTEFQAWMTAGYHPALGWGTDFPVETGGAYMINALNNFDFTVIGEPVDVVYDLIINGSLNMIVYPLGQPVRTTEELAGAIGPCNALSKYDNVNQQWYTSTNATFFWSNIFNVVVGQPLFLNITANTTWPSASKVDSNSDNIAFDNKTTKGAGAGPRIVYFHVQDLIGGEFSYPEDAEGVIFNAWITGREMEVLDQDDVGFGFTMINGNSVAYINLGNFPTSYSAGEQLNFEFPNVAPQGNPEDSFIIPEGSDPIYRCFEPIIAGTGTPLQIIEGTNSIDDRVIPTEITLQQNYPNPFNPTTTISFSIPADNHVKLSVYNIEGQLVKELVNGKMAKGIHNIDFNAESYISGEYIYTLEANGEKISNKMLLIK